MDRYSYFAAVLAATALVLGSAGYARADVPAPLPATGAEESDAPAARDEQASATTVAAATEVQSDTTTQNTVSTAPAEPAAPASEEVTPTPAEVSPSTPSSSAVSPSPAVETTATSEPEGQTAPLDVQLGTAEPVRPADTSVEAQGTASVVASATGTPAVAPSSSPSPTAPASQPGVILERLLPQVERRLRGVQGQMNDLERRLAVGGAASSGSLGRLRRSLEAIAPALVALGAEVNASGRLSPHLLQLLHRVQTRLGDTHASAAALADALRRSGAHGPEVWLLLRELEDFAALRLGAPPVALQPLTSPSSVAPATQASMYAPTEPTAPRQHAAPLERQASAGGVTASPASAAPDELVPQSSASGSASAGPGGGALSAAGLAALAALLGGLALPRLLSRVQLPPMRCYAAVFLVPLQRPG